MCIYCACCGIKSSILLELYKLLSRSRLLSCILVLTLSCSSFVSFVCFVPQKRHVFRAESTDSVSAEADEVYGMWQHRSYTSSYTCSWLYLEYAAILRFDSVPPSLPPPPSPSPSPPFSALFAGLINSQLERLADPSLSAKTLKVSRRDLPYVLSQVGQ